MKFELDSLPYELTALEPYMSARTLEFHYGKHHAGYMSKLEAAIKGTAMAELSLDEVVRKADDVGVFRNAAQTWNHTFFWNSMCAPSQHQRAPGGALAEAIERDLGLRHHRL